MKNHVICLVVIALVVYIQAKLKLKHVISVENIKDYKKVLKTHKNVLTIYSKEDKKAVNLIRWVEDVAKEIKGKGSIVYINCGESKESKKLCKKFSVSPKPTSLKHYKDGTFNKDYDRKDTPKSLLNFMYDPTGDAPWEEDPAAENVVQVTTEKELIKLRRKEKGPLLMMFYAPWCGYCKKLKPDYAAAATEMKGKAVLAGMDVDKAEASNVRYEFNITGYPTIVYFEKGEKKYNYGGGMDKSGLIEWLNDPKAPAEEPKESDDPWSATAPEILHIKDATFDDNLKDNPSLLIMFYAPWCGHCKSMKPEYVKAANQMKEEEIPGTLAAIDCTQEKTSCEKFDVTGYPTVKYFANSEYKFKIQVRKQDKIIEFMKNPEAPPPPPPEDMPWAEASGPEVIHLQESNFKEVLKKKKHVLVMFYAPWCGHCKKAKPEIEKAADEFKDDRKVWFAGVDCTVQQKICEQYDVNGYPKFRYFLYGKKDFGYKGGRTAESFIEFMKDPQEKEDPGSPEAEPQWKDTPSGVVHLGDNDFDDFVKTHTSVLVMFYAPWCGHCKAMKPGYTEAANEMLSENHVIAAIDCTQNRQTASKHDVDGYPTLIHFKDGNPKPYNGGRKKSDIMSYLLSDIDVPEVPDIPSDPIWADENKDVEHLTDNAFDNYMKSNPSVLVMFYAPWCGHCKRMKPAYGNAAKLINTENQVSGKLAAVDCIQNEVVCAKFEVRSYPTVKYFKDGVEKFKYTGGREVDDLVAFMKDPKPEPPKAPEKPWSDEKTDVVHLTNETFMGFVTEHASVMVMFYTPWCGHCKKMKPAYAEAAKIVNTDEEIPGKLAALDCTVYPDIAKQYEIKGYPTVKYFKDGKDFMKYSEERNAKSIVNFMKTVKSKTRVLKEWRSEPSEVHHLTNETLDTFIQDKEVLIMFYAPWCGHCSEMKPAYIETAQRLKDENFPGILAAIDATKAMNISRRENVKSYPTLRYYSNGKFVENFEDHRTVKNMLAFMKKQFEPAGHKDASFDVVAWEEIPSSVVHLNTDTFKSHLNGVEHVLVAFYVKWCKNCLTMRKVLMKGASRVTAGHMSIAAINCDKYKDHCAEQGVTTFASIKYYWKGTFSENYSGSMSTESVVNYMLSKLNDEL